MCADVRNSAEAAQPHILPSFPRIRYWWSLIFISVERNTMHRFIECILDLCTPLAPLILLLMGLIFKVQQFRSGALLLQDGRRKSGTALQLYCRPRTLATLAHFPVKHKLPFRLPSSTSPQLPSFDAIQITFWKLYLQCQALDTTQHMTHKQNKLRTWHELLTVGGEEILLKLWEFGNYVFSLRRFPSLNISKVCFSFRQFSRSSVQCNATFCQFQFWQEVSKHQFNS